MSNFAPTELEAFVRQRAPEIAQEITQVAERAGNEADLVAEVEQLLKRFEKSFDLNLRLSRERTLINGRADAVYNRFVIEYEPPRSLRKNPTYRHNLHAIDQVKQYMTELERLDRHQKERMAGVVLDGFFYIFIRFRDDHWRIDEPVPVTAQSTETFLRYLLALSTELALTPENLVRDFGENSNTARRLVSALYRTLLKTDHPKVQVLFDQWRLQFSEITGWSSEPSNLDLPKLVKNFGINDKRVDALRFFFAMHTYYATFIKLLAVQVATYYMMPKVGTGLRQQASSTSEQLHAYLEKMERGGIFREFGINNFLEGDFFGWYLTIWDDELDGALRILLAELSNYSLVTLDVDPEETRDLLKKLYQNLMPRVIRHALGEYYTPDWLAEHVLNQLDYVGDPTKRLLDPACGSGTFLVLALRRLRTYAAEKMLPEKAVLETALKNIVGFDLNPLAVVSARTNFLLALGDLLKFRDGDVSIPVYLADSVLTPSQGTNLFTIHTFSFNTAVGRFSLPTSLIDARYIDTLAELLEQSVSIQLSREQFKARLLTLFPLNESEDETDISVLLELYDQMRELDRKEIDGIWARIIKNAFAPLFAGRFDYIAGNPPWVNWLSLPENYRKETASLWAKYGLFSLKGMDARLGGAMDDISVLMTYVALDRYSTPNGLLGFVITQSIFKTSGGGKGFRRLQIGDKEKIEVVQVDDMQEIKPFDNVGNQTAVIVLRKGGETKYPLAYNYWQKTAKGRAIHSADTLDEVMNSIVKKVWIAEPVNRNDLTSQWLTGLPKAIPAVRKVLGQSRYTARHGVHTWRSSVYWVDIVGTRPDGLVVISNLVDRAKIKVDSIEAAVEENFVFPLLQRADVKRWSAHPSTNIVLAQDVQDPSKGYPEQRLVLHAPRVYGYFKQFEDELRSRSGYQKYLEPSGNPFYSVYNVGIYTFAPFKVVWPNIGSEINAAVISSHQDKVLIPEHVLTMVPFEDETEAHYVCALINSAPSNFAVQAYSTRGSKSFGTPHVLDHVNIPVYDSQNQAHIKLANLSRAAHHAISSGLVVTDIENQVNRAASVVWELTIEELIDITRNLDDLK